MCFYGILCGIGGFTASFIEDMIMHEEINYAVRALIYLSVFILIFLISELIMFIKKERKKK